MEEEILNMIYIYAFNYRKPDRKFIDTISNIIINNNDLHSFVNDIEYNYDGNAAYGYISKVLRFNLDSMTKDAEDKFSADKNKYEPMIKVSLLEEYIYFSLKTILTILHELEHTKQLRTFEDSPKDSFISNIIQNNLDMLSINPTFYRINHDLFTVERMANINSYLKLLEILKLDNFGSYFINDIYSKEYNNLIKKHYIDNKTPLIEYIDMSNSYIYYDDILINKDNTKKILKKTKKDMSLEDRILYGLPITNRELKKN